MKKPVILCVGGDSRFIYTIDELCTLGKVYSYGAQGVCGGAIALSSLEDMSEKAELLVLPILFSTGKTVPTVLGVVSCDELSNYLVKNALVTGGRINTEIIEHFSALGCDVQDYFDREELVVKNCIPTAEGALRIAMQELAVTIKGSCTVIIGYGRVAKACAKVFLALGSSVTVAARRLSQLAQAENDGCECILLNDLHKTINRYDIVINTVPAPVIGCQLLEKLDKNAVVIDLASKPGGTDFEAAKLLGKRAVHALALPGKTAPVTAGRIIADAVRNIYFERRETDVFKGH